MILFVFETCERYPKLKRGHTKARKVKPNNNNIPKEIDDLVDHILLIEIRIISRSQLYGHRKLVTIIRSLQSKLHVMQNDL